ncbi:hypothetical protein [Nocardia sp. NPDC057440]|uniref:hypothetical protein n=1 Tax=Nocardia sp. NPDC057440 TaxID=3346134 RepID=UPI00366B8E81
MKGRAIGFLRLDISQTRQPEDQRSIEDVAAGLGYRLTRTLVIEPGAINGTLRLLEAAHSDRVFAVIVPSIMHVEATQRGISEQFDLVTADDRNFLERGHHWPWRNLRPLAAF